MQWRSNIASPGTQFFDGIHLLGADPDHRDKASQLKLELANSAGHYLDSHESQVVASVAKTDAEFVILFKEYHPYVHRSLRRLGIPERDLEDVTHEVFLVVHRKLGECDQDRPMKPWIFAIAVRTAAMYRRVGRNRRELVGESGDEVLDVSENSRNAEESAIEHERRKLVLDALGTLDFDARTVLVLHEFDGISVPDICRELQWPLNTAYSRLRLAREAFGASARRLRLQREGI